MKRFWTTIAALAVLTVSAGGASAQFPPPGGKSNIMQAAGFGPGPVASPYAVPVYGMSAPNPEDAAAGNRYGLNPVLKRLFHIKSESCSGDCGKKGHGGGAPAMAGIPNNPATGGTLAFPQHPYVRSPRDFFYTGDK